jgi:hypothetical protein
MTVLTTTKCNVKSCAGCQDGAVQLLCDAVKRCSIINCIGTPVNEARALSDGADRGERYAADTCRHALWVGHGREYFYCDHGLITAEGID